MIKTSPQSQPMTFTHNKRLCVITLTLNLHYLLKQTKYEKLSSPSSFVPAPAPSPRHWKAFASTSSASAVLRSLWTESCKSATPVLISEGFCHCCHCQSSQIKKNRGEVEMHSTVAERISEAERKSRGLRRN